MEKYKELGGNKAFEEFKNILIDEINALNVDGMPKLTKLNALVGKYVNLEYRLPNGNTVKFLDDNATYLGNQLECEFDGDRCFGIAANMDFILISTYEENGKIPNWCCIRKDKHKRGVSVCDTSFLQSKLLKSQNKVIPNICSIHKTAPKTTDAVTP